MIFYLSMALFSVVCALMWGTLTEKVKPTKYNFDDWCFLLMVFGVLWPVVFTVLVVRLYRWVRSDPLSDW